MDACPRYLCTCVYVIVCMSARKKAPVRGHIQTILEKINVIMTLGGEGV